MSAQHIANLKLVLAVLNRAAMDAIDSSKCNAKERRVARFWVTDWYANGPLTPWSFPWVCEHLDLCPYKTRDTILTFKGDPYGKRPRKQHKYLVSKGYGVGRVAENLFDIARDCEEYIALHIR